MKLSNLLILVISTLNVCLGIRQIPISYGLSDFAIYSFSQTTKKPAQHSGVFLINTGIESKIFEEETGLFVMNYSISEEITKGIRHKRDVKVCFNVIVVTLCPNDRSDLNTEIIKKALKSVDSRITDLEDNLMASSNVQILLAKKINVIIDNEKNVMEQLHRSKQFYTDFNMETRYLIGRSNLLSIAESLKRNEFPIPIFRNQTMINDFRKEICDNVKFKDVCLKANDFPYHSTVLSYGSFNQELWIAVRFDFLEKDFYSLEVTPLPITIGSKCLIPDMSYNTIVFNKKLTDISFFSHDIRIDLKRGIDENSNYNDDEEKMKCHSHSLKQALNNFNDIQGYLKNLDKHYPDSNVTDTCRNSKVFYIYKGDHCARIIPILAFKWDTKLGQLTFFDQVTAVLKIPPLVTHNLTDIPPPNPDLSYIDFEKWQDEINKHKMKIEMKRRQTESILNSIVPRTDQTLVIGLSIGISIFILIISLLIFYCVRKRKNLISKYAMPLGTMIFFFPLAGAEEISYKAKCLQCPPEGKYQLYAFFKGEILLRPQREIKCDFPIFDHIYNGFQIILLLSILFILLLRLSMSFRIKKKKQLLESKRCTYKFADCNGKEFKKEINLPIKLDPSKSKLSDGLLVVNDFSRPVRKASILLSVKEGFKKYFLNTGEPLIRDEEEN